MKSTTLVLAFLGMTAALSAQDFRKFHFGFKASPNMSWMKSDDSKNLESQGAAFRFSYGLVADIHFTENYAFGTGFSIMTTGGKLNYYKDLQEEGKLFIAELERNYTMKYVDIPLTLKMKTNEIGYLTYWGQFGLGLGVNINAKSNDKYTFKREAEIINAEGDLKEDGWMVSQRLGMNEDDVNIKRDAQILRTALVFGAGVEYSLSGSTRLLAGAMFSNGFSNALKRQGIKSLNGEPDVLNVNNITQIRSREFDLKAITNFVELSVGIMF
jgi:hypothetical protein